MKRITLGPAVGWTRLASLVFVLSTVAGFGQIGVSMSSDRQKYLKYELVRVRVTLRNYSGNTLVFGDQAAVSGRLSFEVVHRNETEVKPLDADRNVSAGLILGAGETKQVLLSLNTLYDMQTEGVYVVRARLQHQRLKHDYLTDPLTIEVSDGIPLERRIVGLPIVDAQAPIESRTVTLLLFRDGREDVYCLRIEDDAMVYGVVRLGQRISGATPGFDVDSVSNVHVLLQVQPRLFAYRVYDAGCQLKLSRHYVLDSSTPRLERDPEMGRVMVVGGRVGVEGIDYRTSVAGTTDGGALREGVPREAMAAPPPETTAARPDRRQKSSWWRRFLDGLRGGTAE